MIARRTAIGCAFGATGMLASGLASAKNREATLPQGLTATWTRKAEEAQIAGMAVTVAYDARPPSTWTYGYANLPFSVRVDRETLFPICSVSKHLTAMAVLRLVEAGLVRLDEPVRTYVRDVPPVWSAVTLQHLLTHTSGLPDYWSVFPEYDRPQPRPAVLEKLAALPVSFAPGEAWTYSNMNYRLLGWVIAAVSGKTYPEFMRDQVFGPADLPEARIDAAQEVIPHRAAGYEVTDGRIVRARSESNDLSSSAEGGVLFSARDVAPWASALDTARLVSRDHQASALKPVRLSTGRAAPYGYGWYLDRTRNAPYQWHGGSAPGFIATFTRFPELQLSVCMTMNSYVSADFLPTMAFEVAERIRPNSTFLSLPEAGDGSDERSQRVFAVVGGAAYPDAWLSLEAQKLKTVQKGNFGVRFREPITSLQPVEKYESAGGEMVRYRVKLSKSERYILVGWTPADEIFWLNL